ncbi:MAG: hypothetical protein KJ737_03485 [Proteobacteria bacterium]|nr:hypothetical protein [Pseudomonadota bacterium]
MKEYLPIIFAIISGCCLTVIAIKNRVPFFGGLLSQKIHVRLSKADKYIALTAFLFFILFLFSLGWNF